MQAPAIASLLRREMDNIIHGRDNNGLVIFVKGEPGIGKSDVVKQVAQSIAKDMKLSFHEVGQPAPEDESGKSITSDKLFGFGDLRAPLLDVTDLRGIPYVLNGMAIWGVPMFLPKSNRDGEFGILFCDELSAAPPPVQTNFYQLFLNKRIGEYNFPKRWMIVAAGNRDTDRAVTYRMSTALTSRIITVTFDVSYEAWREWALLHSIHPFVLAYHEWQKGKKLHVFDPVSTKTDVNFPCPRTWEFVSKILYGGFDEAFKGATKSTGEHNQVMGELIAGAVGTGASVEFHGFLRLMDKLPNLVKIRDGTFNENSVPKETNIQYAMVAALSSMIEEKDEVEQINNLFRFSYLLQPELAVLMCRLIRVGHQKALSRSKEFFTFMDKYQKLVAP